MENQNRFNLSELSLKKIIIAISVLILLYIGFWFLFSYSWLTISVSSSETTTIRIGREGQNLDRTFEIIDKPKTVFLKRATYKIEATKGDQFSSYKKSLGFLWFNKLDLQLEPQKSSRLLGVSQLPCAKEKGTDILFASCAPIGQESVITSSQRGPLVWPAAPGNDHDSSTAGILKSFKDGYLNAKVVENKLTISARDTEGDKNLSIDNYKGVVDSYRFSVSPDSDNFAIYDNSSGKILNFKNISDKNPGEISPPEDRNKPYFTNKVFVSRDHIYLLSLTDYDLEDHSKIGSDTSKEEEDEKHENAPKEAEQKIFVFNAASGELESRDVIPRNWQVSVFEVGPDNNAVLTIDEFKTKKSQLGKTFTLDSSFKLKEIETIANRPQVACWKDKDSFYYMTDAGRSIYRYSISQQASFLIYGGLAKEKFVSGMQCSSGELYFYFDRTSEIRRTSDKYFGYHHYKLTNDDFTGIRPESITPLFVVIGGKGGDIVEVNPGSNGLKVELSSLGSQNPKPSASKELTSRDIIQRLKQEGVNTDNITFDFKF